MPMFRLIAAAAAALSLASPAAAAPGDILHYVRSNGDGSEPEAVSVYRPGADRVEVFKRVSPCTNAALVTAEFDRATGRATRLVGGRLGRNGRQQPFAWLDHDQSGRISVRLERQDAAPAETLEIGPGDWRLYDFDFADWNGLANGPPPRDGFSFLMALAWPEPSEDGRLLRGMGAVRARWLADETRLDRPARRYALEGERFRGGSVWLDAESGELLEAVLGEPNHPGYRDFRLVRIGTDRGEAAWRALLAKHWAKCPAE